MQERDRARRLAIESSKNTSRAKIGSDGRKDELYSTISYTSCYSLLSVTFLVHIVLSRASPFLVTGSALSGDSCKHRRPVDDCVRRSSFSVKPSIPE